MKEIGQGSHGNVSEYIDLRSGVRVAVKEVVASEQSYGFHKAYAREMAVLRQLHSPNVVRLIDVCALPQKAFIIMEICDYDLGNIHQQVSFSVTECHHIGLQIFHGVRAIHAAGVLHRDIKPANILVRTDGGIKIGDFGLSRSRQSRSKVYTNEVQTLWYRCPEILRGATLYDDKVDIWSVGALIAELLTDDPLFPGTSVVEQIDMIDKFEVQECFAQYPAEVTELMAQTLCVDTKERISASEALITSSWLRKAPVNRLREILALMPRNN